MRLPRPYFSNVAAMGGVTDPAATAFFTAANTAGGPVSDSRKVIYNNLFTSLRSSGWLARLDRLCFPAAESQAQGLVDLITLGTYAITSTMSFAANLGLTSSGTGYIDTGLAPSAAVKFGLNKGMYGVAISSNRAAGALMAVMGTSDAAGQCRLYPWYTDNNSYSSVNVIWSSGTANALNVRGIYMASRPAAGSMVFYRGTALIRTDAVGPNSLDTATFLVASNRVTGSPIDISTDTNAGFWIGDGATNDADQAVFHGILNTYLTAVGAL